MVTLEVLSNGALNKGGSPWPRFRPVVFLFLSAPANDGWTWLDGLKEHLHTLMVQGAAFSPGRRALVFRVLRCTSFLYDLEQVV